MKAFDHEAPESLAEEVELLAAKGERARPMSGGTDLIVQLRSGRFELDLVVDLKKRRLARRRLWLSWRHGPSMMFGGLSLRGAI